MTSPEQFLEYETLRHGETHTGCEERLLAIGERLNEQIALHSVFTPYQTRSEPDQRDFNLLRQKLRRALKNAAAQSLADRLSDPTRDVINVGHYVSDRNLSEIIAIGLHSGALDMHMPLLSDRAPIHIDDLCAGSGILSHSIAVLRGDPFITATNAIEREPHHIPKFEALTRTSGREAMSRFIPIDVKQYRIKPRCDRPTYILAKHACGEASDHILDALRRSPPHGFLRAIILTCCNGNRREPPRAPNPSVASADEWHLLLRTADWITDDNHIEHRIPGRVAMRIIDCLRAIQLPPFFHARVEEILDTAIAPANHAIIVEPE